MLDRNSVKDVNSARETTTIISKGSRRGVSSSGIIGKQMVLPQQKMSTTILQQ